MISGQKYILCWMCRQICDNVNHPNVYSTRAAWDCTLDVQKRWRHWNAMMLLLTALIIALVFQTSYWESFHHIQIKHNYQKSVSGKIKFLKFKGLVYSSHFEHSWIIHYPGKVRNEDGIIFEYFFKTLLMRSDPGIMYLLEKNLICDF